MKSVRYKQVKVDTPDYVNSEDEQEELLYLELLVDEQDEDTIKLHLDHYRNNGIKIYREDKRLGKSILGATRSSLVSPSIAIVSRFSG